MTLSPESSSRQTPEVLYDQIVSSYIMHPAEWNVNKTDRKTQQAIAESLQVFGMLQQLIIEPHPTIPDEYRILGGNHRWLEIQGNIRCNIVLGLTEAQAKKLSLDLNVHGSPDPEMLLDMLTDFYNTEGAESAAFGIPYTPEDIEKMVNAPPPLPPDEEETWKKLVLNVPEGIYKVLMQAVEKTGIKGKKDSEIIVRSLELICVDYIFSLNATTIDSEP
jgi:ParB-like chromosome segregation protein Spo0J